ncbi:Uncharacterised protein [Bordetella ansorpii]|uniref:Uncharacterized protein n=1 Tax=Bordetella ansorpii TaxID=288768 RepID=A0A157SVW2_9BORD|nr:hypothetical protein [Bordetella ansorpii]SAI74600.1 Uncharacterised protein [Bordetella ansorpii]
MTPIQRIRAALEAHKAPASPISKADCLSEIDRIVADVERIDGVVAANDQVKMDVLRASILNIGRLLPDRMSIEFTRRDGVTMLKQIFPEGDTQSYAFTSHTPIYSVPIVPALRTLAEEVQHGQG